MAEINLGGEVDLEYAPAGLRWRVVCPASRVLESPHNWSDDDGEESAVER
jgi:hypothetical protein